MNDHQRPHGVWLGTEIKDLRGVEIKLDDRLARAYISGRSPNLSVAIVTRIEDGKIYCDGSKVPLKYPGRTLIVNEVFRA